jgi:exosortase/archaeosortase family protein
MVQFKPLMIAVLLWIVTLFVLHLPAIKNEAALFFIKFTLHSTLVFGKMLSIPMESPGFPYITVFGYPMKIVMECTAYNFYIFIIYLSLLSPIKWKQRIITLILFIGVLFIFNNLRTIIMGFVGKHSPQLLYYIHDFIWDFMFGFIVFLIWVWRYHVTLGEKD